MQIRFGLAIVLTTLLLACGSSEERTDDGDVTMDTSSDVQPDSDPDTTPDVDPDTPPDVDPDAEPDTGPAPDWADCSDDGFCVLREPGCCQSCVELGLDDYDAVSMESTQEHYNATCDDPAPACPECAGPPPNPAFIAACEMGNCVAYDVRESFHSECEVDDDCIAVWADCCNCGPNVVALAQEHRQAFRQATCDPRADCIDCPAVEPDESAVCEAGRCVLVEP